MLHPPPPADGDTYAPCPLVVWRWRRRKCGRNLRPAKRWLQEKRGKRAGPKKWKEIPLGSFADHQLRLAHGLQSAAAERMDKREKMDVARRDQRKKVTREKMMKEEEEAGGRTRRKQGTGRERETLRRWKRAKPLVAVAILSACSAVPQPHPHSPMHTNQC